MHPAEKRRGESLFEAPVRTGTDTFEKSQAQRLVRCSCLVDKLPRGPRTPGRHTARKFCHDPHSLLLEHCGNLPQPGMVYSRETVNGGHTSPHLPSTVSRAPPSYVLPAQRRDICQRGEKAGSVGPGVRPFLKRRMNKVCRRRTEFITDSFRDKMKSSSMSLARLILLTAAFYTV